GSARAACHSGGHSRRGKTHRRGRHLARRRGVPGPNATEQRGGQTLPGPHAGDPHPRPCRVDCVASFRGPVQPFRSMRPWEYALLFAIVLPALTLRSWNFAAESAWFDEILTLAPLSEDSFAAYWQGCLDLDIAPRLCPVHPVVQFVWSRLFGHSLT